MHRSLALLIGLSARVAAFAPRPRFTPRAAPLRSEDGGFLEAASADIRRPKPSASAEDVVKAQMNALQAGDAMRAFKFASPANKAVTGQCINQIFAKRLHLGSIMTSTPSTRRIYAQVTGPWRRFKAMIEQNPEYRPMLACSRWEFVGMLGDDERKAARVRVFPAGGSSAPFAVQTPVIEYTFSLSKQPVVTDAGEEGFAVSGCWCTDSVIAG